jgi:hypothetical protein
MKKFITLLLVLTGYVCTASAAISGTVYYAINTDYTMKLWVRYSGSDGGPEDVKVMTDTGKTYKGLKIYSASFSRDEYDGVGIVEFQAFDGSVYQWGDQHHSAGSRYDLCLRERTGRITQDTANTLGKTACRFPYAS